MQFCRIALLNGFLSKGKVSVEFHGGAQSVVTKTNPLSNILPRLNRGQAIGAKNQHFSQEMGFLIDISRKVVMTYT